MAGDWIKFESATPDKPEVWAIAEALNIDPDAVVGKLLRVWIWFDQHTEKGNAPSVTKMLLDRAVGVTGFCDAVISAGWMTIDENGLNLPNFDRHNGKTAKNRALTAKRVANHKKSNDKSNADSVSKVTASALPREEKRREDINNKTLTSENDSDGSCDENPPDDPPPEKTKPSKFKFNDEHYQLAVALSCPSKARFGDTLKISLDEWADAIRKLNEIDDHSLADIETLWRWVVADERSVGSFAGWAVNCRSPAKLRQRKDGMQYFDIIKNQMRREVIPHAGNQSQPGTSSDRQQGRPSLVDQQRDATQRWLDERQGPGAPQSRDVDGQVVGFDD